MPEDDGKSWLASEVADLPEEDRCWRGTPGGGVIECLTIAGSLFKKCVSHFES